MSHPDQVDDPPPGDDPVPTELWTPPEKVSSNVGRMAWAMFLKLWKDGGKYEQEEDESDSEARQGAISLWAHDYRYCIDVAKALEEVNQDPSK